MLYFEDGTIDFFGKPIAWFPFMSAPDPTVKRKSGFLFPQISSSTTYGYGFEIPYYLALAPNYDLTLYPKFTTDQGVVMEAEWNQRFINGSYTVKAAGIFQQDSGYFASRDGVGAPSTQSFRGTVLTAGQFDITSQWVWGWTGVLQTDPTFQADYNLSRFGGLALDPFGTGTDLSAVNTTNGGTSTEGVSQLYLAGRGERSYFDIRTIYYYGYELVDQQNQLPIIHPVLDYSNVLPQQVLGGELSYKVNLTSLNSARGELGCGQPDRRQRRHLPEWSGEHRGSGPAHQVELPLARHTRHLHTRVDRDRLAAHSYHQQRTSDYAVLPGAGRRRFRERR